VRHRIAAAPLAAARNEKQRVTPRLGDVANTPDAEAGARMPLLRFRQRAAGASALVYTLFHPTSQLVFIDHLRGAGVNCVEPLIEFFIPRLCSVNISRFIKTSQQLVRELGTVLLRE
jgi:hypothetical protein